MTQTQTTARHSWIGRPGTLMAGLSVLVLAGATSWARPTDEGDGRTIQGTIRSFTTAPRGEVDGAVLDDGTVIHWPPHTADEVTGIISRKDRVKVTGQQETDPEGNTHFEVRTIANVRSGKSVDLEDVPPPLGPRGPRAEGRERRPDDLRRPPERAERSRDDRDQRLRALEERVERLQRELDRLRREK